SAPMPRATGVRACGPRALESFTRWPAPISRRPTARPTCPAPRIPICIASPKIQRHHAHVVLTMCVETAALIAHVLTLSGVVGVAVVIALSFLCMSADQSDLPQYSIGPWSALFRLFSVLFASPHTGFCGAR